MRSSTLYREDLAWLHHTVFDGLAREAAPGLLRILRAAGVRKGALIDLGCGSGLWARAAQQAGFAVTGVDCSAAMIRLARKVSPQSVFHCASLHDFHLPSCNAVTVLGEALNYLAPGRHTAPGLERLFKRIAKALQPGGLLVFDLIITGRPSLSRRLWRDGKNWAVLVEANEDQPRKLLSRKIVTFRHIKARWRRTTEIHRCKLYTLAEVQRALRASGFTVRITDQYGQYHLLPRRRVFIACRQV